MPGKFPSPFLQQQPASAGHPYPQIQFLTNSSASQPTCHLLTGKGCVLPPKGAHFYPYFTLAEVGGMCVWEYGNMPNGNAFGGDKQYGKVRPANHGAFAGPIRRNPSCWPSLNSNVRTRPNAATHMVTLPRISPAHRTAPGPR
jgi:hypothetical protein